MNFSKHVKIRREKFGAVIFDTLREKVFVTNQTGAVILMFLEDGKSAEDFLPILANQYDGDTFYIRKDAVDFIKDLEEKDLLIK